MRMSNEDIDLIIDDLLHAITVIAGTIQQMKKEKTKNEKINTNSRI